MYLKSIGFSVFLIGLLEGIAEATAGLSKGYFGNLSDKLQLRVPFIRCGYILSAISKPMMAVCALPLWIFGARALDRLGKGVRTSARDALLSDETVPEHKAKVFGFHRGMDTLGAALGPVFALIILYFYPENYKLIFIVAFLPGIIAVTLTFLLSEKKTDTAFKPPASAKSQPNPKINSNAKSALYFWNYFSYWKKANNSYKKLVAGLLTFTLFNSSDAFLLLALKYKGFSDIQIIGFYIFYNFIYAGASYPVGVVADKLGAKKTLVCGFALFAIVYFLFGSAVDYREFIVLFFIYALYAVATEGVSKALISNLCAKNETATAIDFYTSVASVFTLLASALAGLIWANFGYVAMFAISGIGAALVALYLTKIEIKQRITKLE